MNRKEVEQMVKRFKGGERFTVTDGDGKRWEVEGIEDLGPNLGCMIEGLDRSAGLLRPFRAERMRLA